MHRRKASPFYGGGREIQLDAKELALLSIQIVKAKSGRSVAVTDGNARVVDRRDRHFLKLAPGNEVEPIETPANRPLALSLDRRDAETGALRFKGADLIGQIVAPLP